MGGLVNAQAHRNDQGDACGDVDGHVPEMHEASDIDEGQEDAKEDHEARLGICQHDGRGYEDA